MSLESFAEDLRRFRQTRDWQKFHTPQNLAAAIASEAGELLHLYRWTPPALGPPRAMVAGELADVLIFALNLADVLDLDVESLIQAKIEANELRWAREQQHRLENEALAPSQVMP